MYFIDFNDEHFALPIKIVVGIQLSSIPVPFQ